MAYTLPANKYLAVLSNLITAIEMNDTLSGRGVDKLIDICHGTNLDYGGAKIINSANVPEVEDYDEDMSPLTRKKPEVDQQVIEITDYKVVRISVNRWLLATAFLDASASSEFMGYVLSTLQQAKKIYMYKTLVKKWESYTPVQATQTLTIALKDTSGLTTDDEIEKANVLNAKKIAKALLKLIKEFDAPTSAYNDLTYEETIDPARMNFISNSKFDVDLIVDTYATLFNSEAIKGNYEWGTSVSIPEGQLSSANKSTLIGFLAHKGKLTFGYGYEVQTSFFNPATLDENNFLHFNYYMDFVKGLPCVKILASYTA